jgi:hypothetical protein
MKKLSLYCGITLCTLLAPCGQGSVLIQSVLSGNNTIPASGSLATGFGSVLLDDFGSSISVTLSVFNLQGFATSAGIYGPAFPGDQGPLVFPLSGIAIPPSQKSFTITGQFSISPTDRDNFLNRLLYFNVFSTAFPEGGGFGPTTNLAAQLGSTPVRQGGELRGQINVVPEPKSALLVVAGLGLLLAFSCRHRFVGTME